MSYTQHLRPDNPRIPMCTPIAVLIGRDALTLIQARYAYYQASDIERARRQDEHRQGKARAGHYSNKV